MGITVVKFGGNTINEEEKVMPILKSNRTKCNGWRKYEKDYSAFISKIREFLAHLDSKKSMTFKPVVSVIVIFLR